MRRALADARQRRGVRQSSGALAVLRRHPWPAADLRQGHAPKKSGRGLPHSKTSRTSHDARKFAPARTADFQSAVSRISNPQGLGIVQSIRVVQGLADWKSAIQQVGNLRHNLADFPRRLGCARFETVKTVEVLSRTPITPLKRGVNEKGACGRAPVCTADFQSAVSRISNPQGLGIVQSIWVVQGPADWKSRYSRLETCGTTSRTSHAACEGAAEVLHEVH